MSPDNPRPALAPWGVMLPNFNPFELDQMPLLEVARMAEELGFDAVWVGDHLAFHPPVLEATAALAAAAAVTERIGLGFAVLLAPMRQPVWLAKSLATIDQLAPGRLIAGFGVGGEHPAEWEAAGTEVRQRGRRLDEFLEVLPDLLNGRPVDHRGPDLSVHTPPLRPPVSKLPPIVIGGRSEAAIRRAARFGDAWLTVWMSPDTIRAAQLRLTAHAEAAGNSTPETMMVMFVAIGDDQIQVKSDAARLFAGQYNLPFDAVEKWTVCGPIESVATQMDEYRDAGVTGFVVIPARPDQLQQVQALAEVRTAISRT